MHDYHPGLEGYDERQIWHDGCDECENRGKKLLVYTLDRSNQVRAYDRAMAWGMADYDAVGPISKAERPLLEFIIEAQRFMSVVLS